MTGAIVVAVGCMLLAGVIWLFGLMNAPTWVTLMPWWLPTVGALGWSVIRPTPAVATDDDDDSWIGYSLRSVVIGEDEPRPLVARLIAATVVGAPVAWALLLFGFLSIIGIV